MKKTKVVFVITLDTELLTLPIVYKHASDEQLQLGVKETLLKWNKEGILFVPDGGNSMRFWPQHRVKFIEAAIEMAATI